MDKMQTLLYFFLPLILALGIITSYEDVKYGKIRNKWVICALGIAVIVYASLFLLGMINSDFLAQTAMNLLFVLIVSFLTWFFGFWSAGDAKLFTAYTALIPLAIFKQPSAFSFPFVHLLANTAIPAFIFPFSKIIKEWSKSVKIIREMLTMEKALLWLLSIFALSWIAQLIFFYLKISSNFMLGLFLFIFIFSILQKTSQKLRISPIVPLLAISVIRIGMDFSSILTINFLASFLSMTVVYGLVILALFSLGGLFTTPIKLEDLKAGMLPAEKIIGENGKYRKIGIESTSRAESLTKEDIKRILALHKQGKLPFDDFLIQQTLPFAPFMFLGAILTLIFGETFIIALIV